MPRIRSSSDLLGELGRLLDRRVQVVDVRLMMLAVMDLHRLRVDVRLERVVGVRERRQRKGHCRFSCVQWLSLIGASRRALSQPMTPGISESATTMTITCSMCWSTPGM